VRRRVALLLTGALAAAGALLGAGAQPAAAGHEGPPYFDLGALPAPSVTGADIWAGLQDFINAHPYRVTGTPMEIVTATDLRDDVAALGYDVKIHSMPVDPGTGPGVALKAIIATKRGTTKPDDWIVFTGHYDTVPQTIYGAYDNGSGANLLRFLARAFAHVPTNRSLVFVWFNGEEEGALASDAYAKELKAANQKITADLGFDMEGIAWPVAAPTSNNCLCLFHGANDATTFRPLMSFVNYDFLGFPNGTRQVRLVGTNDRNSDERSFAAQGYPTMRWAGMRTAASYPAYHMPDDTLDKIVEVAGGASYYEQGIENTLKSAYYTALALDNHLPEPQFGWTADGATVSFDGSASADEDGDISSLTWDFGDGATGSGAQASHTYAAPGTYTVTLTAADNLWPDVTNSITLDVTVA